MTVARVRGIDLVYQTSGSGSPMIWGHGMTSSMASERNLGFIDWTLWNGNAQLIRYDARGHGEGLRDCTPGCRDCPESDCGSCFGNPTNCMGNAGRSNGDLRDDGANG
jgi:pimeloyl-ACP methyl ester carboxylesterase